MMSVIVAVLGLVLWIVTLAYVHFGQTKGRHAESNAETVSVRQLYAKLGKEEFRQGKHTFPKRQIRVISAAA